MKSILTIVIFLSLVVSGATQTRNVVVGTNGVVVSPTNFWSADVTNARSGLGLGSAATNPASAFQPSSINLSNVATNNGGGLTNLNVTNLVGVVSLAQGGTGATNNLDARNALGLGTAATNPATAFQASSANLTNLAANNGGALTNLAATSIVGIIPSSNISTVNFSNLGGTLSIASGGTSATNAANARQNLGSTTVGDALFIATNAAAARTTIGTLATNGNGAGLTNLTAANITGTVGLASNVTGTIAISNGGSGATTAGGARTNLGLGATNEVAFGGIVLRDGDALKSEAAGDGDLLIGAVNTVFSGAIGFNNTTNSGITRTNLGLGATNNAFSGLSVGTLNTNLSTNDSSAFGTQNFIDSSVDDSFAFGAANKITNMPSGAGGSIVMGILGNMTNQGAFLFNGVPQGGTAGNSRGNNTFAVNASNGIYLNGSLFLEGVQGAATDSGILAIGAGGGVSRTMTNKFTAQPAFFGWDGFVNTAFSAAQARTNIGLSFAALTNTNTSGFNTSLYGSGTNPVLVNTSGSVVSPTNFWQVAPLVTTFIESQPTTNQTTNIAAGRNLHIHSIAFSTVGITNTIALPTTNSFNGDIALVVHQGPTSSVTAVRTAGAATNLVTMNQFEQTVEFVFYDNVWQFNHNRSFIEPIFFSGTNAAANAAASRTNLGLGTFKTTDNDVFSEIYSGSDLRIVAGDSIEFFESFSFGGTNSADYAGNSRTSLGLGLPALTNTSNVTLQSAVFTTNAAPTNSANVNAINFNTAVRWMNVTLNISGTNQVFRIPLFQ
jgi:hypothetical protein